MKMKRLIDWLLEKVSNYNIFLPEEDQYNNENEQIRMNAPAMIQHQKYSTRLYILLLILFLYIIFFIVFVRPQTEIVTISNITPTLFEQLRREHDETLSCPCSSTLISYNQFVSNILSIDPVCSSVFVSDKWINALYLPLASSFLVMDFRTTAHSQFELLAALCSVAQERVSQALIEIDQHKLLTMELLLENEVQSEVIESIKLVRASTYVQINSPLTFLQITTQSNSLISALNTNVHVSIITTSNNSYLIDVQSTVYLEEHYPIDDLIKNTFTCNLVNSITPSGFYWKSIYFDEYSSYYWPQSVVAGQWNASAMVNGFFSGCTPLDGLLPSTLDCLYNVECLQLLEDFFPNLNETSFNLTNSVLPSNHQNISLSDRLSNLFITEWLPMINYSKYFTTCAPLFCTYTTSDQSNLFYTIVFLLSLYGGLTIILRLIAPSLVNILSVLKFGSKISIQNFGNGMTWIRRTLQWIKQLNMFKSFDYQNPDAIKRQYIITRVYLILLAVSIVSLLLFTSFSTQITTMTVPNPSLSTYKNFQLLHSNTLKCPCSMTKISYETFISLSPTFHQVCSSDFVSDSWILLLMLTHNGYYYDWISRSVHQFRLLSTICDLTKNTINDAVQQLIVRSLVTSNVLTESDFIAQLNTTINQFLLSIMINFGLLVDTVHLFTKVDQPYKISDYQPMILNLTANDINNPELWKLMFPLTGVSNTSSTSAGCVCATDPHCQSPSALYDWTMTSTGEVFEAVYIIPGSIDGCFTLDSFLLSTLECYYSNSNCLSILIAYMNVSYSSIETEIPWFVPKPLVYNPLSTRFPPNTSLSVITKEMMIEQWNYVPSFDRYYEACKPHYCTYSYRAYTYNYAEVMIKMISVIGGLTVALRLITPQLVTLIVQFFKQKVKQEQRQDRPKFFERMKLMVRSLINLLYTEIINLTIFPQYTFGNTVNRIQAKRLNQLSTRLCILLLIIGFIILSLHTLIQPQLLTETFIKPSLTTYEHLLDDHGDTLQCTCSLISSPYDQYITIEPIFHQICSSSFISDEWRMNFTSGLVPNLSIYDRRDYRRFLSAHLQFLNGLCDLSNQSVNAFLKQFLSSLFITVDLLPQSLFNARINSLIEESKSNAPPMLLRLLFLLRTTNHANAIISTYGTNFEYIIPQAASNTIGVYVMPTEAITYDNECLCALNASCTIQAAFIKTNSSEIIRIKGLKMGCTPSESFLASTLECFYDSSCINLIQEHVQSTNKNENRNITLSLAINTSRFQLNTTIMDLLNDLFIENWSTTINYSLYFDRCSPTLCSYTYIQRLNSFYTITQLLGLCGGLITVLKWICPTFIYLLFNIYQRWKRRTSLVHPIYTIQLENISSTCNTPNSLNTLNENNSSTPMVEVRKNSFPMSFNSIIFGLILFIIVATFIIIPTVYFTQRDKIPPTTTILSILPMYKNVSTTSISTSTEPVCQLTFELKVIYSSAPDSFPFELTIADLNEDKLLDLIVLTSEENSVGVLLNNGNGTFATRTNFGNGSASYGTYLAVGDFNNDSRLDLIMGHRYSSDIEVLIGMGDGTFKEPPMFSTANSSYLYSIAVGDFNSDDRLDFASTNVQQSYVGVMLGNGDGTFGQQMTYPTGNYSDPYSIAVGDFNGDGRLDLAVTNAGTGNVGIMIGNGDGTFGEQTTFPIGDYSFPTSIAVGDLNSDHYLDLAVVDSRYHNVNVFLGNGNGSFGTAMTYSTGVYNTPNSIVVVDVNGDTYLDLAVLNDYTDSVGVFLGNGNGTFQPQIQFSIGTDNSYPESLTAADFNGDNRMDFALINFLSHNLVILFNTCECCMFQFVDKSPPIR